MVRYILHAVDPGELFEHGSHVIRRNTLITARVELSGQVERFENMAFVEFGANFTFDGMAQHSAEDGLAPVELKLTGRPVIFAPTAASGSRIISCLQPNEPPIGVLMARTWLIGIPSSAATHERTPNVDCVGDQTVMRSVPGL